MQNSCVKLVTGDKAVQTVLPVKVISIVTFNGTKSGSVYFIFSPFSLN